MPKHIHNPRMCAEYSHSIHTCLMIKEAERFKNEFNFKQNDSYPISTTHRETLIEFMSRLAIKFDFKHWNTLFISVLLLDRFLHRVKIPKSRLQLVASTCWVIAEKYQEIYPIGIDEYCKASANIFNK